MALYLQYSSVHPAGLVLQCRQQEKFWQQERSRQQERSWHLERSSQQERSRQQEQLSTNSQSEEQVRTDCWHQLKCVLCPFAGSGPSMWNPLGAVMSEKFQGTPPLDMGTME